MYVYAQPHSQGFSYSCPLGCPLYNAYHKTIVVKHKRRHNQINGPW